MFTVLVVHLKAFKCKRVASGVGDLTDFSRVLLIPGSVKDE